MRHSKPARLGKPHLPGGESVYLFLEFTIDWRISIDQRLAAYQSSICFRIVGEEIERSKAIGAGCKRKVG